MGRLRIKLGKGELLPHLLDPRKPQGLWSHGYLAAAIIARAIEDYIDFYQLGFINDDHTMHTENVRREVNHRLLTKKQPTSQLPRHADVRDVVTCISFLFDEGVLESFIPNDWVLTAPRLRDIADTFAKRGQRISSLFSFDQKIR